MKKIWMCSLALVISYFFMACNMKEVVVSEENDKMKIVVTTTMLYDLVCELGGDKVDCTGLMGVGIDPHLYKASAGDIRKMGEADVVIYNGYHLEGEMGIVFANLASDNKAVLCIEEGLDVWDLLFLAEEGWDEVDPHIWFSVPLWIKTAEYVTYQLADIDKDNGQWYIDNFMEYKGKLEELDQYITQRIQEIPKDQRILITAHDAFGYFGRTYGMEVMGIQGISTETEASIFDLRELATFIVENQIKAIFIETSVSTKNMEALQAAVREKGFEVSIGGALYSDSLGNVELGHDTYIATLKANVDTMVDVLK